MPFLIGTPQELNSYSFVNNNPINSIDPFGLKKECVLGKKEDSGWVTKHEGKPSYELSSVTFFDITGPVGVAIWKKMWILYQSRTIGQWEHCYDYCTQEITSEFKILKKDSREKEMSETLTTNAYRLSQGGDPEGGDFWWTKNPWTGQTVKGRMQ